MPEGALHDNLVVVCGFGELGQTVANMLEVPPCCALACSHMNNCLHAFLGLSSAVKLLGSHCCACMLAVQPLPLCAFWCTFLMPPPPLPLSSPLGTSLKLLEEGVRW